MNTKRVAEYWNNSSDKWYENANYYLEQIINDPTIAFPPEIKSFLNHCYPNLTGLNVCVPSSGDNLAVFAFYLLGANVCSIDISEKQINNAKKIAQERKWDIQFLCNDSMSLDKVKDNTFDLIYTSNGVHVWISDLNAMYRNFNRILKDNGNYIFFETHPMSRPFNNEGHEIKIVKEYKEVGPFSDDGVNKYEWRIQDFINSLVISNFEIKEMSEFNSKSTDFIKYDYIYGSEAERKKDHGRMYNWKVNPWAALPQCFGLWSIKK